MIGQPVLNGSWINLELRVNDRPVRVAVHRNVIEEHALRHPMSDSELIRYVLGDPDFLRQIGARAALLPENSKELLIQNIVDL